MPVIPYFERSVTRKPGNTPSLWRSALILAPQSSAKEFEERQATHATLLESIRRTAEGSTAGHHSVFAAGHPH